ncbi:hypothetical protein AAE478_005513 [Parahypoxylon ruwenzoriense]
MFSEYASRFLAQSQSRLSNFGQPDNNDIPNRQSQGTQGRFSRHPARSSYQGRLGNPYQPSNSRFGGFSRYNTASDAPLFHSALNEFREEEDDDDAREAADLRALQRSRRVFVSSRLEESSASENDDSRISEHNGGGSYADPYSSTSHPAGGIKSSWNGESSFRDRHPKRDTGKGPDGLDSNANQRQNSDSDESGKMVDIGLDSTVIDNEVPEDLLQETPIDSSPPAFQQFKSTASRLKGVTGTKGSNLELDPRLMRQTIAEEDEEEDEEEPGQHSEIPMPSPTRMYGEIFVHDQFFAWIYLIAIASLLATFVLVWLHTSVPGRKIGDTIYTTLHSSFHLLAVDTLVSIIVALVWMAALRSFVQPLALLILLGVPIVLFSFSLYPMISSFQGPDHGSRLQDVVMRYAAIIPGVCAIVWVWLLYKGRHEIQRAIDILDFSSRILAANPALVLLGFGSLAFVVGWTWVWLWMFTRIFLGGYFSKSLSAFIIGTATWWLAIYFFIMYVWTLSVMSGVVRATTGGTVSNWYFFRNNQSPASSNAIVKGALGHSTTTVFGTICASTLLSLAVRLPILVLPRRISSIFEFIGWRLAPRPVSVLTNPLALTYASIHSLPLMESASQLSRIQFLATGPTTTLTPSAFSRRGQSTASLMPYRMAKMLLHAARFVMSTALGFAAWVMTARQLQVQLPDNGGVRGSAYAYVVGIVAGMIGWGVLGAMEGILSGILDAVLICYASERRLGSERATYCIEAARLFEERRYDERDMV